MTKSPERRATLKRRGLIAGAAALVAGIAAQRTAQPVAAAATMQFADTATTVTNTALGKTLLVADSGFSGATLLQVDASGVSSGNPTAIAGLAKGTGYGVSGAAENAVGVFGSSSGSHGVMGILTGSTNGTAGVNGQSDGSNATFGVLGDGDQGIVGNTVVGTVGVQGQNAQFGVVGKVNNASNSIAVFGNNTGSGSGALGVKGLGSAAGVVGVSTSTGTSGVVGFANNYIPGPGIFGGTVGVSNQATLPGVYGYHGTSGPGVRGATTTGSGVYGTTDVGTTAPTFPSGAGVQGLSANGYGVVAFSTNNVALYASSNALTGVYGQTSGAGQFGVIGTTTVANSFGLAGVANQDGCAAFAGGTTNANAFAASFQGHVQVFGGAFDVAGMGNKHGIAEHPDGSYRTFYSVESPECWVEDFGEGTLTGGKAEVKLDADFTAMVHTDHYHVFLTPHGDHHLHIAQRQNSGFNVEADLALAALKGKNAAQLSGTFSWRVVAKPKTEAKVDRLAKARLAPRIDFAKLPKPPAKP